MAHIFLILK